jgi:hypothetical protein
MFGKIRFKFYFYRSWETKHGNVCIGFDIYSWLIGIDIPWGGCVRLHFGPLYFDFDAHPLPF